MNTHRELNTRAQSGSPYSPCIASTCLEELDNLKAQGIDGGTIRDFGAGVYVEGADTVRSLYLPSHPTVTDFQIASRSASKLGSRYATPSARLEQGAGRD